MRNGRLITAVAAAALWTAMAAGSALAQEPGIGNPPPSEVQAHVIALAKAHVKAGEESFARGDFDHARTEFDTAVDVFLTCGYDLRSSAELQATYRETVERVNRYQAIGLDAEGDSVWPLQEYEATNDDFRKEEPIPTADEVAAAGDFRSAGFLVRVAELQRRFHEKFGRQFTLTGRDTPVHSRLYGYGRAADVRVSDLAPAHVQFIVQNARALNMRVLDFSTSDRVLAHNMRVLELGRPADTLATGMHLHLNDLPRSAGGYGAVPAAKQRVTSGGK
jgi:hypothetical protein